MDKRYSIKEVFELIGKENLIGDSLSNYHRHSIEVDGYKVYSKSLRYMVFYQKGTTCVCCGRKGTHFRLDGIDNSERKHFNLYCDDGMLMTKDHIVPKALGGRDVVSNLQPMCNECNIKKGDGKKKEFSLFSVAGNGEIKKYKDLASLIVSLISNKNKKGIEEIISEAINKADGIREALENGTMYRNRRWYSSYEEALDAIQNSKSDRS